VAQPDSVAVAQLDPPTAVRALTLALLLMGGVGCANNTQRTIDAGGGDAVDGISFEAPATCTRNTVCDGDLVRSCEKGQTGPGPVIEECADGQVCNLGRCTSPACKVAEREASLVGCLFYTAQLDNVDSDDAQPTMILVTNPGDSPATVSIETRAAGQSAWILSADTSSPITLGPGAAGTFSLSDSHLEGSGKGARLARRVSSDMPITVMALQSDDATADASSSAGTLVLPAHVLGTDYMAITYKQVNTAKVMEVAGSRGGAGEIGIVATQDGTHVTVTASATAPLGFAAEAPGPVSLTLDDGDLYQLFSAGEGEDLSGSTIAADKPIAVFSGNISTTYGYNVDGISSADMASEQMMPIAAWSSRYVAARLMPSSGTCDLTFGTPGSGLWRILASVDETRVDFTTSTGMTNCGLDSLASLARGEVADLHISCAIDFLITANHPIYVIQAMDCEATLSSAVPTGTPLQDFLFALPPNFEHELVVVRQNGAPVSFDGQLMTETFEPADQGFEVADKTIPPCFGTVAQCLSVHRLTGAFGATLRGMDVVTAYAVTAPTWSQCMDTLGCIIP
jgi:hypothetical protein